MTLSTKKANCGDPIGRISDLPSNFINGILDHLNARDLVRTSVLSRKWRYMWITVPRLKFCRDFYCRYEDLEDPGPEVSRIITEVLFLHNMGQYIRLFFDSLLASKLHHNALISGFCFCQGKVLNIFCF
jgi:hypothetical protein